MFKFAVRFTACFFLSSVILLALVTLSNCCCCPILSGISEFIRGLCPDCNCCKFNPGCSCPDTRCCDFGYSEYDERKIDNNMKSFVKIKSMNGNRGSGVLVTNANGDIFCITAAHVMGNESTGVFSKRAELTRSYLMDDGTTLSFLVVAKLIAHDENHDVAILQVDDSYDKLKIKNFSELYLGSEQILVGRAVYYINNFMPDNSEPWVLFGRICKRSVPIEFGTNALYADCIDGQWQFGISGGGVYDSKTNKLIGITIAGQFLSGNKANLTYYVPVRDIIGLAKRQNLVLW